MNKKKPTVEPTTPKRVLVDSSEFDRAIDRLLAHKPLPKKAVKTGGRRAKAKTVIPYHTD
jgi:hypothetical protein